MMIAASRLRPAIPVVLPFPGSVPQFAALVKVDGALEGVVRLALVQSDLDPPSHAGVGGPVDHEQGAFDAADLPQGGRQLVLARVRGELAQDLAGPQRPGGHGGRDAQDVRPVPVDQVHVHLAAEQRAQELRDAGAVEDVEPLRRQVPDARDEGVSRGSSRPAKTWSVKPPVSAYCSRTRLPVSFIRSPSRM